MSLKYIVCSDLHLGHDRTPTKHIVTSIKKNIFNHSNKDVKAIFFAGDTFDKLLDFNSTEVIDILTLFDYILDYCTKYDTALRVLEGTPSHDWNQSKVLVAMNESRSVKANLRHVTVLDIEYLEPIGKYVLYLPDEWVSDHSVLESQIESKLKELSIDKVDIAIVHGMFRYQCVGRKLPPFYLKEEYFLSIAKEYIHSGHIHSHSKYDRIVCTSSLDRLAFNEEEPKGYVLYEDGVVEFIENKLAYTYKTIKLNNSITFDRLDRMMYKLPKDSYVRLITTDGNLLTSDLVKLRLRYSDYIVKVVKKESGEEDTTYILTDGDDIVIDNINISNVPEFVYNYIDKTNYTSSQVNILQSKLNLTGGLLCSGERTETL